MNVHRRIVPRALLDIHIRHVADEHAGVFVRAEEDVILHLDVVSPFGQAVELRLNPQPFVAHRGGAVARAADDRAVVGRGDQLLADGT